MLGSKLEQGYYWYNDEYMYFSFNGHHSSKYHLFIQNSKELTIENSVGAASEYSNATMQEGTYYLGTSRKQKTFKRKCAAELNNMRDYRRMMKWLTVGTTGELVFDSDRYWGWSVVLDTIGDATFAKRDDLLIVEFEITFKTIGTYLAHSVYPATWIQESDDDIDKAYVSVIGTNQYNIPTVFATQTRSSNKVELDLRVLDLGNMKQDLVLSIEPNTNQITGDCDLMIEYNGKEYLYVKFLDPNNSASFSEFEYNSSSSTLFVNGELAEENEYCKLTRQTNGVLELQSNEPIELYTTSITSKTTPQIGLGFPNLIITVTLDEESWAELKSGVFDYICISNNSPNYTTYSESEYDTDDYNADSYSYVGILNSELISNKIGSYVLIEDTHQLQLIVFYIGTPDTPDFNNNFKVYCGNLKQIKATLNTSDTISSDLPFTVKVTSYNNL